MTTAGKRIDDDRLDRLVDGELNEAEYRELLRSLEQRPGGWRACALAFLEAQAWRRELGELRRVPDRRPPVSAAASPVRPAGRSWTALLTLAASFLLVFALGVTFHAQWPLLAPGPASPQVAGESIPASPPEALASGSPGAPAVVGEDRQAPVGHSNAPSGNLQLVVGDDQRVDVPLYEWTPGMLPQPAQVPPEVQRAMQRMGRQLRWERQFVPLNLEGGRRAVLPVEQLEVTPVEHGLYQ